MQIRTLLFSFLLFATILPVNSHAQNWYWVKQADSAEEYAGYDAVDRNGNPSYVGYFFGTSLTFGSIGDLFSTGSGSDFLVKYTTNGTPLWARNATQLNIGAGVSGMSVTTDRNNNVIETGYYNDSIAFGSFHLSTGSAFESVYIVKYDANGNVIWAETSKADTVSSTDVYGYSIKSDTNNNLFVTGYYEGSPIFGNDTLPAALDVSMFLVKYDPNGNVLWTRTSILGTTVLSEAYGASVAVDDSGNAYVGGTFEDSLYFGPVSIVSRVDSLNIYMVKYDPNGNVKWALAIPAYPGSFWPTPVTIDRSGNIYIAAQFTNPSLTLGTSTITDGDPPSCSNSLLAKYDRNGNPIWATCANYVSADEVCVIDVSSIATDRCNNVFWSGICSDTFAVGNVKITVPYGGTNPSLPFTFVIKLDSTGHPIAGAGLANQSSQYFSNGLAIDSLSRVYFDAVLSAPPRMVLGSDTVYRFTTEVTSFISKFSIIPSIHSNVSDSICLGDSLVLSIPSVTGLTYTWSTGSTTDSIKVKPAVTTTYYVVINNLCNIDTSFIKVVVSSVNPRITGVDSICHGDTAVLIAGGGLAFRWSSGQTTDSIKVAPATATTYTLTVTTLGCSRDTTFTLFIKPTPVGVITPAPADSLCRGDSVLLTGNGGTNFLWNTGATTGSIWVSPTSASTYTLHVTSGGCSDSTTQNIKIILPTTATVMAIHDTVCPLGTATLTVSSSGQATYQWNTGATTSAIQVSPSVTTTYTVNVFGVCDSIKDTVRVFVAPLPTITISGDSSVCSNTKDTLKVSGGVAYLWGNGDTSATYITGAINGDSTISVIGYNSLGCQGTKEITVTLYPSPDDSVTYAKVCKYQPVVIFANAKGTGPFTYSWSPGGQTTDSITVADSGQSMFLYVSNGCKIKTPFTVIPDVPALTACCDKIIFLGDDTILVAGGANRYQWSPSVICLNDSCDSVKVNPTVTTTYTVTGKDSLGCENQRTLTIIVEVPCFNFTVPNVFTPNYRGPNGLNNVFYIKDSTLNTWSIVIFDRWGKEIYESSNKNQYWNGDTESGDKAPDGVYYYVIKATCQGNTYKKEGFVQLIR